MSHPEMWQDFLVFLKPTIQQRFSDLSQWFNGSLSKPLLNQASENLDNFLLQADSDVAAQLIVNLSDIFAFALTKYVSDSILTRENESFLIDEAMKFVQKRGFLVKEAGDAATLAGGTSNEKILIKKKHVGELLSYKGRGVLFMGTNGVGKSALSIFLLGEPSTGYLRKKKSTDWKFVTQAVVLSVLKDGRLIGENLYDLPLVSRMRGLTFMNSELHEEEIKFVVLIGNEAEEREKFFQKFGVHFEDMGIEVIRIDPQQLKDKGPEVFEFMAVKIRDLIEKKVNQSQPGGDVAVSGAVTGKEKVPSSGVEDKKGGIDLNPAAMDLQTEGNKFEYNLPRDGGGAVMPGVPNLNIQGLYPVIINIMPIADYLPMIGIRDSFSPDKNLVFRPSVT